MPTEKDSAAQVIAQDGDWVKVKHKGEQLTVRLKGFPADFKLAKGNRVILFDEPSETVARPLVRVTTASLDPETVSKAAKLEVDGRRLQLQESTISEQGLPAGKPQRGDHYVFWVQENCSKNKADQVVAFRKTR